MKTKAELALENAVLSKENGVMFLALTDLSNLGAKWFGHSREFSIGISRPDSACGGIAVVKQNGSVSAHYFEEFAHNELNRISAIITGQDNEYNRALLCRRASIEAAQAYVSQKQAAA